MQGRAAVLADATRISATSDVEAVAAWLEEYRDSAQTFRAYRKEAERLLLWLDSQGLTLSSLRRTDWTPSKLSSPTLGPPRAGSGHPGHAMQRTGGPFGARSRRRVDARAW